MKIQLPNFNTGSILVSGDLMLDRYWLGGMSRISPEAPVPVVNIGDTEQRAGGAGNVALNVAALLGGVKLLGLVGKDEPATALESILTGAGVACHFIAPSKCRTITKLRVMSRNQQLIRLDFEDGFLPVHSEELLPEYQRQIDSCNVIVLADYGKGSLQHIPSMIDAAISAGKTILIDPKSNDFSIYRNASLITPNQAEFEAVVGSCTTESEFLVKGEQLREDFNLGALLVTRSEKGMVLFQRGEAPFIQETRAREVFDVTGAGDTVIGTLAAALAAGSSLIEATQIANLAAGIVVRKMGTATTTVAEIQSEMLKHTPLERGVSDESNLISLIQKAKDSGERIVMTNGCFDILHAGHVAYLALAAELGDRLIVAVNSDDSVKRLKGEDRPINTLMQRMVVLSGLESVDWVVGFNEDTPARLIEQLLPDILVKGGDYRVEDIAGGEAVKANGGVVKILNFVDSCSTSAVIAAIKKRI